MKHIFDHESLTESSRGDCSRFIERLDNITKPPVLPPRSGRSSTTTNPVLVEDDGSKELLEISNSTNKGTISQEYLEQQREISRSVTLWKADSKPVVPPKPSHVIANAEVPTKLTVSYFFS